MQYSLNSMTNIVYTFGCIMHVYKIFRTTYQLKKSNLKANIHFKIKTSPSW